MCPADQALKLGNYQNLGITSGKAEEKVFGNSDLRQLICNYAFDPTNPWKNRFSGVVNELKNEMREIKNLIIGLKDGR